MYYFAYGSNLNRNQMKERCPGAKPFSKATLPNYKLIFTGWTRNWRGGTASIKPFRDEKVIGGIYEISENDLKSLDKYEGYPAIYNHINVIVFTPDDEPVKAVTYIKVEQSDETKPSAEYLAILQKGFKDWGLI